MSLKLYSSFIKKDKNNKVEDIAIVCEKFSFSAFFLSLLWFLFYKMWQSAILLVLVEIVLVKLRNLSFISNFDFFMLNLAILFFIAMNASSWRGKKLEKKDYKRKNYVLAQNEEEARLKAMKSWHRNSPDLGFQRFSEEIIDPHFYLKSVKPQKIK